MTNAEFYKDEIKNYKGENFCGYFVLPKIFKIEKCKDIHCNQCIMLQIAWLLEEHKEPEIDWENVPIDTPILVRNGDEAWKKRHFAGVGENGITAWIGGYTSFTSESGKAPWLHAKLWEGSEEQAAEQRKQEETR